MPNICKGEVFFVSIEMKMADDADMIVVFGKIVLACAQQVSEIKGVEISTEQVVIDSFNLMDICLIAWLSIAIRCLQNV